MGEQVPFINRENELDQIEHWIGEWGTRRVICIHGEGGIGKTRLLQEVSERYAGRRALLTVNIIDFDDRALLVSENVGSRIAHLLSEREFKPYLRGLRDYHKMEAAGVSLERLTQEREFVHQVFIDNFNQVSVEQRVILPFDTTDALEKGSDVWNHLLGLGLQLENVVLLIAGRNAKTILEDLQPEMGEDVQLMKLSSLEAETSAQYLRKKQEMLHVTLAPEISQKLLLLAHGRPILIDLAVEWMTREIQLPWLVEESVTELQQLPDQEMEKRQKEFEYQLVRHIDQIRTQMDRLILAMCRVYPLNTAMIAALLNLPEDEAEALFREAQTYIFVKSLPNDQISLHDEMRRMVNTLWSEIDPDSSRRCRDSRRAAMYLEQKASGFKEQIAQLSEEDKVAHQKEDTEAELDISLRRGSLEQDLLLVERQRLEHLLFTDVAEGVETFASIFDYATRAYRYSFRDILINLVQQYAEQLSPKQRCAVDIRRAKHMLDVGKYEDCRALLLEMLDRQNISPAQKVDMLIELGNAEIRMGDRNGLAHLEQAARISEEHNLEEWLARSLNALGWQHRVRGSLNRAMELYERALEIALKRGDRLREAWILNNLAFVHGIRLNTQVALALCDQALDIWRELDFARGIGAVYQVYGTTYRKAEQFDKAFQYFNRALRIFEPTNDLEWLSRIYLGRGMTCWLSKDLDEAERDLRRALEIGIKKDEANILHQLAHVHTEQGRLDEAEACLERSYEISLRTADPYFEFSDLGDMIRLAGMRGNFEKLDDFAKRYDEFNKRWPDTGYTDVKGRLLKYLGDLALQATPEDITRACECYRQAFPLLAYESYTQFAIPAQLKDIDGLMKRLGVPREQVAKLGECLYSTWKGKKLGHPEALRFFLNWIGKGAGDASEQ